MANKFVSVGIARTRPRFDGKFPYWLGMGMGMCWEIPDFFN